MTIKMLRRENIIIRHSTLAIRLVFGTFCVSLYLMSCDDEETAAKGKYERGTIVINEGGYGAANGTLTFYSLVSGDVEQNIFKNDAGDFAGDVVQSLSLAGDQGYIVINGDNKIEVVNKNTFESLGTITNEQLDKPRYMEVINGKAYISVWGPYEDGGYSLVDSYILVIDLDTNEVVTKIETDEGTEVLLKAGDFLFASNYNYGGSNSVAVIDVSSNTLKEQIEVGAGPAGLVADVNGNVWALCTGDFGSDNGTLHRINAVTLDVEESIALHVNPDADLAVTPDKGNLIYTVGSKVYKISVSADSAPEHPLFTAEDVVYNYALGIDPESGDIWIGDAVNFATAGIVYVYSPSGALKHSFTAGIGPTQFVFK